MSKIDRNSPCPCGSGKKAKKCCGTRVEPPPLEVLRRAFTPRDPFAGPRPVTTMWQGKRFRAVWNYIYWREPTETFHEFLIDLLKLTLGEDWIRREASASPQERHAVMRWLYSLSEITKSPPASGRGAPYFAEHTGDSRELIALAYDIYKLLQVHELPAKLIARLRNRVEFQGARYEVAIAASFVRKGFKIEWNRDTSKRGPEFTAVHPVTGEVLAVETKSRRRRGTLNERGELDDPASLKADVRGLVESAVGQAPGDKPFAIFVDANLPTVSDLPDVRQRMMDGLRKVLDDVFSDGTAPHEFSILALTSFAWHYRGSNPGADRPEYVVARSTRTQFPLKDEPTFFALLDSLATYGRVPVDERDPSEPAP